MSLPGAFGAAVNGATMPVFAVLFSEVIQVSIILSQPGDLSRHYLSSLLYNRSDFLVDSDDQSDQYAITIRLPKTFSVDKPELSIVQ